VKESDSTEEIKKIYRQLAKKYHPDSLRSQKVTDPSIIKTAKDRFRSISVSYNTILKLRGEK
jgi:DnaJ-class molecular chaperone